MKFFKAGVLVLSVALAFSLALPGKSFALFDALRKNNAPSRLQQFPIHDEESFLAKTKAYHQVPFNNPILEFDMLLPKDWETVALGQDVALTLSQKILNDAARFKSPMIGTEQAVVTVQFIHLTDEISAGNWLKNYIFTNGHSLQEKIALTGDKRASGAFISIFEGKSTYTYTTVQINGNLAVMARFEIPLALKDALGFLQKRSMESFRLIAATDDPVETQKTYRMGDALKFSYPESWALYRADTTNPQRLFVQIHSVTQAKKIEGIVQCLAVQRVSGTSLAQELEKIKAYLGDTMNLDVKTMLSSGKAEVSGRFLFSRAEVYRVAYRNDSIAGQELRLAVLGDKDWYILLFLLTPTEANSFYTWASNTRVFDLIVKNLK